LTGYRFESLPSSQTSLDDRMIAIAVGQIAFGLPIALPRPRRSDDPAFGQLKARILDRILRSAAIPNSD